MVTNDSAAPETAVHASNRLTSDWIQTADFSRDCLLSGFSAWHLLSILGLGAHGEARKELAAATSVDKIGGQAALDQLISELTTDMASRVGLWIAEGPPLNADFLEGLPRLTIGTLLTDDSTARDQWVADATGGLIVEFPAQVTPETLVVIASALGVDANWLEVFDERETSWQDDPDNWYAGLRRTYDSFDQASVVEARTVTISRFICKSDRNIDVHLVGGSPDDDGRDVLEAGMACLRGDVDATPVDQLELGTEVGCLTVNRVRGAQDYLAVSLPKFSLAADHNLVENAELFGLSKALDQSIGHFEHISPEPLAIEQVRQITVADFDAAGFRAAAVTIAMAVAGGMPPPAECTEVALTFDRPFGFLAVHRPTNLVLFAGWIGTTDGFDPSEWALSEVAH